MAISSNIHPAGFVELMPKTRATATVDRLPHRAHICVTSGESVRLAQATSGAGVKTLVQQEASRSSRPQRLRVPVKSPGRWHERLGRLE